jgi:hypothetical protein
MKVLIATPVYGDTVSSGYHSSILETIGLFAREFPHIEFVHAVRSTSFFPQVRNILASDVLNDETYTHLLLIDPDMGFSPALIAKMLAFGKPVVGAIYPEKKRDYDSFRRALVAGATAVSAELSAMEYVYGGDALVTTRGRDGRDEITVVDGFVRVKRAGTGILLVAREALARIRDQMSHLWKPEPEEWVRDIGLKTGGYLQCFSVETGADGLEIGSDVAFSRRWVDVCGGEIWSCVDEAIIRTGGENYVGHFLTQLMAQATEGRMVVNGTDTFGVVEA